MEKLKNILWGIVFILLGIALGLNAFGITHIAILFDGWWTLLIIIPCLIGFITEKEKSGNLLGIIIGIILLLAARDIITYEMIAKLVLPTILIILGISFITKKNKEEIKVNDNIKVTQKDKSENNTENEKIIEISKNENEEIK